MKASPAQGRVIDNDPMRALRNVRERLGKAISQASTQAQGPEAQQLLACLRLETDEELRIFDELLTRLAPQ